MNFKDLLEESIRFAKGKDDDFYYKNYAIVTFTPGDLKKYKVEGKTAGLWSHACKHLSEIDPGFVNNIIRQVKQTIEKYVEDENHPKNYELNLQDQNGKEVSGSEKTLLSRITNASIINFLDLVNDKYQLRQELTPIEKKMVKFLDALGTKYGEFIENVLKKAVDVDQFKHDEEKENAIKKNRYIAFTVVNNTSGRQQKITLDTKYHILIISTGSTVNTCFQISNSGNSVQGLLRVVKNRIMKHSRCFYNDTTRVISNIIKHK